jgi:hypothetical protein
MQSVSKRCRGVSAALFLVCVLTAGVATAQDREEPRHPGPSFIQRIILWAMDGLSFPPG